MLRRLSCPVARVQEARCKNVAGAGLGSRCGLPWVDYANLRRALATAATEAGLGHIRATSILLQQADLATASKYVGHRNPAITAKVYSHAIGSPAEQAARVAEAMNRADFGPLRPA